MFTNKKLVSYLEGLIPDWRKQSLPCNISILTGLSQNTYILHYICKCHTSWKVCIPGNCNWWEEQIPLPSTAQKICLPFLCDGIKLFFMVYDTIIINWNAMTYILIHDEFDIGPDNGPKSLRLFIYPRITLGHDSMHQSTVP